MNELYERNKFRKYKEIEKVENDIILKARVKNFLDKYGKILLIILSIILVLLIGAFYSNFKMLTLSILMLIMILFLAIYYNTFTIICKNNKMIIKINMQEIEVKYSNLKNIYIENKKTRIFIKKRDNFSLIILYKTPTGNISNIHLPIIFLKKNDIVKFLETFKVKETKSDNVLKAQQYQLKRLVIKIGLFIVVWGLIILTIICT